MHNRLRPRAVGDVGDRLKLHRREVWLRGRRHTVVSLRPGADARFSTNFFHGTWHILSDWHGARLLGRLLWGLAYQRVPGTLLLIDRPFLDPNPFDSEPADPIVVVPADLTSLSGRAAHELRRRLPLAAPSAGTVRWQTHGLAPSVAALRAVRNRPVGVAPPPWDPPRSFRRRIDRVGGLITLTASADMLKELATDIHAIDDYAYNGSAYTEVDWPRGEVQVFRDYRRRVSVARVARREVLAEQAEPLAAERLNPLIWHRGTVIRHRPRRVNRTRRSVRRTPPGGWRNPIRCRTNPAP